MICIFSQFRVLFFHWLPGVMRLVCIASDDKYFKITLKKEKLCKREILPSFGVFFVNGMNMHGECADLRCWT